MVCADWILYAERRSSSCAQIRSVRSVSQIVVFFVHGATRGAQRCRCNTRTFSTRPRARYGVERGEGYARYFGFGTHRYRSAAVSRPRHLTWLRWLPSAHRRSCRARSLSAASVHSGLFIHHIVSVSSVVFQECAKVRQSKVSITKDCIEAIVRCHVIPTEYTNVGRTFDVDLYLLAT